MVQLKISGLKETQKLVNNLTKNVKFETMNEAVSFLKEVRKEMLLRAPVDTGELKSGIGKIEKGENYARIVVQGRFLIQQEEGQGMPHYMPISLVKDKPHRGAKQASGTLPPRRGMVIARRYTPFVLPALTSQIHKLNYRFSKATNKAIKGAKR